MAITRKLRFEILSRDGFQCRYCGKRATEKELHVDHVFPRSMGGGDEEFNLVAACHECNFGKRAAVIGPIFVRYYSLLNIHNFLRTQPEDVRQDLLAVINMVYRLDNWLDKSSLEVSAMLFAVRKLAKGEDENAPYGAKELCTVVEGMVVNLLELAVPIAREHGWLP
jgi:hypothetical protein